MGERRHVLGDRQVDALAAKFDTSDFIMNRNPVANQEEPDTRYYKK
jgi:hypothetical protein